MTADNRIAAKKRRAGKKSATNKNQPRVHLVTRVYTRKVEKR